MLAPSATALKLFPADAAIPATLEAQRAVIPRAARILAVGGIAPSTIEPWRIAGADGFRLGSGRYRPDKAADAVAQDAETYIAAVRKTG